jgi:hypothetical protein
MGRKWVLDTETKGTGAEMVPLERTAKRGLAAELATNVVAPRRPRHVEAPAGRSPRRFRVVDVMTNAVTVEDASARATVEALEDVRSVVDARVYVWEEDAARWRRLSLGEQKALWALRQT